MNKRLHTVEEVYFLVRVGQWDQERLEQWLRDSIDAEYNYEYDMEDFEKDWTEDDTE